MAKYDPLHDYLNSQTKAEFVMDFNEIEKVLGTNLPPSAHTDRTWWANVATDTRVQQKSWMEAGYSVYAVDLTRERITFKRH